jgi:hypothetical protein
MAENAYTITGIEVNAFYTITGIAVLKLMLFIPSLVLLY